MKKYKYNIVNLDCANCAREVEESLNKDKRLHNVIVNFGTLKLSYETDSDISLKEINGLARKVEPDVIITKEEAQKKSEFSVIILCLGVVLGLLAYFVKVNDIVKNILFVLSYSLLLYKTFINSIKLIIKSKTINENLLITISCIGAFVIGEKLEGIMVITLYIIGKILEEKAINNSRKSINGLINLKENIVHKRIGKDIIETDIDEVRVNDILIVKKGERIPVDGIIMKGDSLLDTSSITGESDLVSVKKNDNILSGSINQMNVIEMKATNTFSDSLVSKVLELLEEATDKKTKTETLVNKISKVYTPVILIFALLVVILLPMFTKLSWNEGIYRGLTFLVISCPCAIAISVPLSYFIGIGVSSKNGILIKGSNYLDNISSLNNIIFDKTGTLTNGSFEVSSVDIIDDYYDEERIMDIVKSGESLSNHPIANSILNYQKGKIKSNKVSNFKELEGKGIIYNYENKKILIGNKRVCNCNIESDLHININGKHIASIKISDGIKANAYETIQKLKKRNIKTYIFTGDKKDIALAIGKKLGINEVKYEMLPTDKYENYEKIASQHTITAFVGDGVNDAPVLKRADIGISMGGVGSESAIEASDIVLMKDDLSKISLAIDISKFTNKIIKQNLIFAIMTKVIILALSVFGLANMWFAVFADTGVTLLTILNTLRIVKNNKIR